MPDTGSYACYESMKDAFSDIGIPLRQITDAQNAQNYLMTGELGKDMNSVNRAFKQIVPAEICRQYLAQELKKGRQFSEIFN